MAWTETPCEIEARDRHGRPSGRARTCRVSKRLLKIVWSEASGVPWPEGMYACHHCDEPRCANPMHIFPGTPSDNSRDAFEKRGAWGSIHEGGERHRFAKLTWPVVRDIRRRAKLGVKQVALATEYGINPATVSQIVSEKRWRGDPDGMVR